jgi:cellulose synthase/poly-beta-1,6-N-acetylglucosamine synthase-like glycosyltransferase
VRVTEPLPETSGSETAGASADPAPTLSVIVPVRNGAGTLAACLGALSGRGRVEVIVVDDASSDGSGRIAERFGARVVRLAGRRGPGAARNAGAALASGAVLAFVDADVALHPGALDRIVAAFAAEPALDAVFGSYDDRPAVATMVGRYRNLLHHFFHQRASGTPETFWAGIGAVRASRFWSLGGFSEEWCDGIEDIELGRRLRRAGASITLDRNLLGTHMKDWTRATMVRTDFCKRALPWTRLILAEGKLPTTLNASTDQRLGLLAALTAIACAFGSLWNPWWLAGASAALIGVLVINRALFALFRRLHGEGFMLGCLPLLLLYYAVAAAGFAAALAVYGLPRLARSRRIAPALETAG